MTKSKKKNYTHKGRWYSYADNSKGLKIWVIIAVWAIAGVATAFVLFHSGLVPGEQKGTTFLKVDKVTYDEHGTQPFIPPAGEKYVVTHITVKNDSDDIFYFAPVLQTYISDDKGHKYQMSPVGLRDPIAGGQMNPSEERTGSLSFLVPKNTSGLRFHFEPKEHDAHSTVVHIQ